MNGFIQLLRQQAPLLGFGALFCFTSSFGQTFFIAVFGGAIRSEFAIGHGAFGAAYSAATLASAVTLIWLGKLVDRMDARWLAILVVVSLALAALLMSFTQGLVTLVIAFYGLRLMGQGMAGHIAISTMAKRFAAARGRAISIVSLGMPLSEMVMPLVAVLALELGWRWGWRGFAAFLVLAILPALLVLLRRCRAAAGGRVARAGCATATGAQPAARRGAPRRAVLAAPAGSARWPGDRHRGLLPPGAHRRRQGLVHGALRLELHGLCGGLGHRLAAQRLAGRPARRQAALVGLPGTARSRLPGAGARRQPHHGARDDAAVRRRWRRPIDHGERALGRALRHRPYRRHPLVRHGGHGLRLGPLTDPLRGTLRCGRVRRGAGARLCCLCRAYRACSSSQRSDPALRPSRHSEAPRRSAGRARHWPRPPYPRPAGPRRPRAARSGRPPRAPGGCRRRCPRA